MRTIGEPNAYNERIADKNQLSDSSLIENDDNSERTTFLATVVNLPHLTYTEIKKDRVKPAFDHSEYGRE